MARLSDIVLNHAESPSNVGWLENADATATTGALGRPPFMAMCFRIRHGIVTEAKYRTFGCAPAVAAGSVLTEMMIGHSVEECLELTEHQLTEALGGIPAEKDWCVDLALSTMRKALMKYGDGPESVQAGP